MSPDQHYQRDERFLIRLTVVLGVVVLVLALVLTTMLDRREKRVAPGQVWPFIQEVSAEKGLDPGFVYAIAWAESSLNARARSSVARGMMQLTKPAWEQVSDVSYRRAWNWKTNIRVGVDYLVFCRDFLQRHDSFSYPLLAASYRYGPNYVKRRDFDLNQLRATRNKIYQSIFAGDIRPVSPPRAAD